MDATENPVTAQLQKQTAAKVKRRQLIPDVHSQSIVYDHTSKDRNDIIGTVGDHKERNQLSIALVEKYWGQTIDLICLRDGRIQTVYMGPSGPNADTQSPSTAVGARCWAMQMLFGDWRIATREDVKKQEKIDQERSERDARLEAKRMAKAAGLMFREVAGAADAIQRMNNQGGVLSQAELADAVTEPTAEELDNIIAKAQAAKAKMTAPPVVVDDELEAKIKSGTKKK